LLAAGKGTRLGSLSQRTPKPMLEIAGKPILQHNIELCRKHGITDLFINTSHLAGRITDFFGDGTKFGVRVKYSYEPELLGTAGALNNFREELRAGPFFVIYADNFSDFDLTEIFRFHVKKLGIATIALYAKEDVSMSGIAVLEQDQRVVRFIEKPNAREQDSNFVNAGIYVLSPRVFSYIPSGFSDFGRDIFPTLLSNGEEVFGIVMQGRLLAADTEDLYKMALQDTHTHDQS
jgi:NDP-sugar pyrophosphorylase family protein